MDTTRLHHAIRNFSKVKILVVGDVMLDHYTFGDVSRISPEAPVPVLKKTSEMSVLGGAGNVAANVASLGARVAVVGIVGSDHRRHTLFRIMDSLGVRRGSMVVSRARPTVLKHRFIAGAHQLLRMDDEHTEALSAAEESRMLAAVRKQLPKADLVVLSDYDKGCFSRTLARAIIALAKTYRKMTIADMKPVHKEFFTRVTLMTPNLKEGREMTGLKDPKEVGARLVKDLHSAVLLTLGAEGIMVCDGRGECLHVPARKVKVFDVSGAGDTVVAAAALGMASGLSVFEAGYLANLAANIVVQKLGTATVSREELESGIQPPSPVDALSVVPKVWGHERWLENNDKYCCKLLAVSKGCQCSLHYHKVKDETFLVVKGHVRLELGSRVLHMYPGDFMRIHPGTPHRFRGIEDSEIIEISTHHDEADSYRLEKSRKA